MCLSFVLLALQEAQRQVAGSESAKNSLQQTVSEQAVEVSKLTEDLAQVTAEKDSTEAMLNQTRAEARHNLKVARSGKENTDQILQTSKAELAQLEKDLVDAKASRSVAEVKDLQATKAEAETAAATKLKVCA